MDDLGSYRHRHHGGDRGLFCRRTTEVALSHFPQCAVRRGLGRGRDARGLPPALLGGDIELRHARLGHPHLNAVTVPIGENPAMSSVGLYGVALPRSEFRVGQPFAIEIDPLHATEFAALVDERHSQWRVGVHRLDVT